MIKFIFISLFGLIFYLTSAVVSHDGIYEIILFPTDSTNSNTDSVVYYVNNNKNKVKIEEITSGILKYQDEDDDGIEDSFYYTYIDSYSIVRNVNNIYMVYDSINLNDTIYNFCLEKLSSFKNLNALNGYFESKFQKDTLITIEDKKYYCNVYLIELKESLICQISKSYFIVEKNGLFFFRYHSEYMTNWVTTIQEDYYVKSIRKID